MDFALIRGMEAWIKSRAILFCLLGVLALFNGCGESYRGAFQPEVIESDTSLFNSHSNRYIYMDSNVDRLILNTYENELRNQESDTEALTSAIKAFDLTFSKDDKGHFIEVSLLVGCSEQYIFEVDVVLEQLQNMQVISMGSLGDYEVEVRCTSRDCDQMVAAIRKFRPPHRGTVLTGLELAGYGEGDTFFYKSRYVPFQPYFATFPDADSFLKTSSCPQDQPSRERREDSLLSDLKVDSLLTRGKQRLEELLKTELNRFEDNLTNLFRD